MAMELIDDELGATIEPLLPKPKPRRFRYPGRKPLEPRKALTGVVFVLRTGIPWNELPGEMGCGSGRGSAVSGDSKPGSRRGCGTNCT